MDLSSFVARADDLINLGHRLVSTSGMTEWGGTFVDDALFGEFRAGCLSYLRNVFGTDHPHYQDFNERVAKGIKECALAGIGIMSAVRGELAGGWFRTTVGLISAQIFSSFIDMAEHLLEEGYKDAAAVMLGSVLEQHLRQLATNHKVPITGADAKGRATAKKADTLNADLVKAGVYNLLDQKQITAWLDLRNKAAHGDYDGYTKEHVELMKQGLVNLMTRIPS
jgi:hypothetical protein